jgi:ribosomal protein S18 acetylase RimI-like enzyme
MAKLATYTSSHARRVQAIANQRRLAGQPPCSIDDVDRAARGANWSQRSGYGPLVQCVCLVELGEVGQILAAGAVGRHSDSSASLLWLCAERDHVPLELLQALCADHSNISRAFAFASDLAPALEGLPRSLFPEYHQALVEVGFLGSDLWSYMYARPTRLIMPGLDRDITVADVVAPPDGQKLLLEKSGDVLGYSVRRVIGESVGFIDWIEIDPRHRSEGLGRTLLELSLWHLHQQGCGEYVLLIDDDEPEYRDRTAAVALYVSMGFREIARLWTYEFS